MEDLAEELRDAAYKGDAGKVESVLTQGAPVDAANSGGDGGAARQECGAVST